MLKLAMVILVVVVAMSTLATAHTELVCDVFHRLGYLPSTSMFISGRFLYVFNDQQYFRVPTGDLNPTGGVLMNLRGVQFQPIPVPNFGKHIAIIDYIQEHVLNGFGHHILLRTFNGKCSRCSLTWNLNSPWCIACRQVPRDDGQGGHLQYEWPKLYTPLGDV